MATLGGKRIGAGRKKAGRTVTAEKMRECFVNEVAKKMPALVEAHMDLALGHHYEKMTETGVMRIYKASPEQKAGQYLLDQGIGKPKESIEHSGSIKTLIVDF